jgi:hypothetical protein
LKFFSGNNYDKDINTNASKFFYSLKIGGLLDDDIKDLSKYKPLKSLGLLLELHRSFPRNFAYSLMILTHQIKHSFNQLSQKVILNMLQKGRTFNAHYSQLLREFILKSKNNQAFEVLALISFSKIPYPSWGPAINFLFVSKESHHARIITPVLERLGKSLVEEGVTTDRTSNFGGFIPIEFQTGRNILKRLNIGYPASYIEIDMKKSHGLYDDEFLTKDFSELQRICTSFY